MKIVILVISILCTLCGCGTQNQMVQTTAPKQQVTQQQVIPEDAEMNLHVLDVGEGNAVLIESNGHYMLVDGGENQYSSYVVSYLKSVGVESLDYVIASHYDADHLAGIVGALHVFPTATILGPDYETDTKIYHSFQKIVAEKGYTVEYPVMDETYTMGAVSITIVGPAEYGHKDENEDSLGLKISCGETEFLLCGDTGKTSEEEMMNAGADLDADVLLVNHHGSDTSTCETFLNIVDPDYAIISSGTEGNAYNHPHAGVLERLQDREISLYRTDQQGEIVLSSDGQQITFEKEACDDFTPGDEKPTEESQNPVTEEKKDNYKYILNKKSRKFHYPDCKAVKSMKEENKIYESTDEKELIAEGYEPCGWCAP